MTSEKKSPCIGSKAYKQLEAKYSKPDYIDDLEAFGKLSQKGRDRQADRAALLHVLEQYKSFGLNQEDAIKQMIVDYKNRTIEPRTGIHGRIEAINRPSLLRWKKQVKDNGWSSLAGDFKSLKKGYFDDKAEALELLIALRESFPEATIADIHKALAKEIKSSGHTPPTIRMVAAALKKQGL